MPGALARKDPRAAREVGWQWVCPATALTRVAAPQAERRSQGQATQVQKALQQAVARSQMAQRAAAQTLRHSVASPWLQAPSAMRTLQEWLGHSDGKTTLLYTQTVRSGTRKEAKSPLDF